MKESEKTKRISIAAVLFILAILIGFLSYKKPKFLYNFTPEQATEKIILNDFLINLNQLPTSNFQLVDIRSLFEFQKGHLDNAINMQAPEILNDENVAILNKLQNENITVILYGEYPNEALAPYMVLYQLGYTNLKLLTIETSYIKNKLITTNVNIENPIADIATFINESKEKSAEFSSQTNTTIAQPKKVITVQKRKKSGAEGGC